MAAIPTTDCRVDAAISADQPVKLPAAHPVVTKTTPLLEWKASPVGAGGAAAVARMELPQRTMLKAFGKRLRIGPAAVARTAARDVGLLRFGLSGNAWRIYLDELVLGGLLNGDLTTRAGLDAAVEDATIATVANI